MGFSPINFMKRCTNNFIYNVRNMYGYGPKTPSKPLSGEEQLKLLDKKVKDLIAHGTLLIGIGGLFCVACAIGQHGISTDTAVFAGIYGGFGILGLAIANLTNQKREKLKQQLGLSDNSKTLYTFADFEHDVERKIALFRGKSFTNSMEMEEIKDKNVSTEKQ